jgi:two-component system, response regulator PdtaR
MIRQSVSTPVKPKSDKPETYGKVLVVSADASNKQFDLSQADSLKITQLHSPVAALELCQSEQFDLALIDMQIDEPGAIELARSLYQQHGLRTLFVAHDDHFELIHDADDVRPIGLLAGQCSSEYVLVAIRLAIARVQELRALTSRESQLVTALNAEREINTAIGILMERMQLTRTDAFETLRRYARSQRQQMAQIAAKMLQSVNETNELLSLIGVMSIGRPSPKPI